MSIAVCPPLAELERLYLGGLPEAEVEALEQHVLECRACLDKLKTVLAAKDASVNVLTDETQTDAPSSNAVLDDLMKNLEALRPTPASPKPQGTAMIALTCSACQKKLSVKENLAGKKVKCPGCGQLTVAPTALAVGQAQGRPGALAEERTPAPNPDLPTNAPSQPDVVAAPTHPPSGKPDATVGVAPDAGHDSSLIDFLAPPQADDELGRLGKYRILNILGHGGMGVVYKAEDPKLKRLVAIKAMLPALAASASCGKRFLIEAEAMAKVGHDHIVRIHQIDEERSVPFLVMEFLKGEPLDERLKRDEPMPLADLLRIGREIADGLAAAHATGLIHRDIKPGNIWLEAPKNRVKILDFGLARAASQEAGLTQQGAIIGTPAYMAPEQGRGAAVDARCDLFSLGVVLYRMSTGQQPFHGNDTVSTLMSVAMHEPPPAIKLNADLPPAFSDLVMKLLEKEPEKRVATADEVIRTLQGIEQTLAAQRMAAEKTEGIDLNEKGTGEPRPVRGRLSAPAAGPSRASARRKPPVLIAAMLFLLVLLGGAGTWALVQMGVIRFSTPEGDFVVNTDDPDFKFSVSKGAVLLEDTQKKRTYSMKAVRKADGEYEIEVTDVVAELSFKVKTFTIKRGEQFALTATFEPKQVAVVNPKDVKPPVPAQPHFVLGFDGDGSVTMPSLKLMGATQITLEGYVTLAPDFKGAPYVIGGEPLSLGYHARDFLALTSVHGEKTFAAEGKSIVRGKRCHVAGVLAGKQLRLFLDGKRVAVKDTEGEPLATNAPRGFSLGRFFVGAMSEVRISKVARYDKDFTPAQRFKPDADTLALYHCDEGSGDVLKDTSGNAHHGKIVGAKWVTADGTPIGPVAAREYALRFGPEDSVDLPSLRIDDTGPITVEALATASDAPPGNIFGNSGHLTLYRAGKIWAFACNDVNSPAFVKLASPAYRDGERTHIAAVRSGNHYRLFVNGKMVADEKSEAALPKFKWVTFQIGKQKNQNHGFTGIIDEVRISKVARYDKDFTPAKRFEPDADTLALYHFDEGSGDVLKDFSGNGHHGKIVGAKWVKADGTPIGILASDALKFDGKAAVIIRSLKLPPTGPFTLECYASQAELTTHASIIGIITQGILRVFNGGEWEFAAQNAEFRLRFTALPHKRRMHIAVVRNANDVRLFMDGALVQSKKLEDPMLKITDAEFRLGDGLIGTIGEARVSKSARYDKDFTPAQRFESDADTLALYHCDEGSGDVLKDSSGNAHHGKIVGAKWVKAETPLMPGPQVIDLIAAVDIPRHVVSGEWKKEGTTLLREAPKTKLIQGGLKLSAPAPTMPEDYDIDLIVERLQPAKQGGMAIGFLFGGKQATVNLDAGGQTLPFSGLEKIDDVQVAKSPTRANGERLHMNEKNAVRIEVRKEGVRVYCDGDKFIDWRGQPSQLSLDPYWKIPAGTLFLGTEVSFRIHKLTLTPRGPAVVPAAPITPEEIAAQKQQDDWAAKLKVPVEAANKIGMKLRLIPPGDGAAKAFYLGKYEVTQGEWQQVMGYNYSQSGQQNAKLAGLDRTKFPVDNVNWFEAVEFCNKLSEREGLKPYYELTVTKQAQDGKQVEQVDVKILGGSGYHIPTDAEWDHGCRAGTKTKYHFGDNDEDLRDYAWFKDNSDGRTHAVGEKRPNAFGLYDMHGNVNEWNEDMLTGAAGRDRVQRGGHWRDPAGLCAVSNRLRIGPGSRNSFNATNFSGLRVARAADGSASAAVPPLDPAWLTRVSAMKGNAQLQEVKAELMKRNPGFDGKLHPVIDKTDVVTDLTFNIDKVTDISPVRALAGLTTLHCRSPAGSNLSDLSPLEGMKLGILQVNNASVIDLSPLKGMPLKVFGIRGTPVSDLSPLTGMPLDGLDCAYTKVADLSPLKDMKLAGLDCAYTKVSDLSPLKDMELNTLHLGVTEVSNLTPLKGMPIISLTIADTKVSDLSPLKDMKLRFLACEKTKVFDLSPLKGMPLENITCDFKAERDGPILRSLPTLKTINGKDAKEVLRGASSSALPPLDPDWLKAVAKMPAVEQGKAVSEKMKERNPGFDGRLNPKVEKGGVTSVFLHTDNVRDISPLRTFTEMKSLTCIGSAWYGKGVLVDLSPLKDTKLTFLACTGNKITNLTPLKDLKLTTLMCGENPLSDLTPLTGMPLAHLTICGTKVSALAPLEGMPLTYLNINRTPVADFSPLKALPLTYLRCDNTPANSYAPLQTTPLKEIVCTFGWGKRDDNILLTFKTLEKINGKSKEQLLKERSGAPAFEAWLKKTASMKGAEQVNALSAKLKERNPGFDGTVTPVIDKAGVVIGLTFLTDNVTDLSPVRALTGLKSLHCNGTYPDKGKLADLAPLKDMKLTELKFVSTKVEDLTPLKDMPLTILYCGNTEVMDLTPLKDMKLTELNCAATKVSDLAPLKGMKLTELNCAATKVSDLAPLKGMKLTELNCGGTPVSDLLPLQGMKLTRLDCVDTKVTDLAPLKGMPLQSIRCDFQRERDAEILRSIKTLERINLKDAKEFLK